MGLLQLLKQAFGNPQAVNVVQPQPPHVYLKLRFKDPEGAVRDFPAGIELNVRFGTGPNTHDFPTVTAAGGKLSFSSAEVGPWANDLNAMMRNDSPWRTLTLTWDTHSPPHSQFIVCERRGSPATAPPTAKAEKADLKQLEALGKRYFSLPQKWALKEADLASTPKFAGNGSWDGTNGAIRHTANARELKDIGKPAAPVELVLNLHWKFLRFQYFDRYFGPPAWASSPVATRPRVTIPPVSMEGFRERPEADWPVADTHSNWTIGADAKKLLQCLPWIVQRPAVGKAGNRLTGADVGLRFRTEAGSYVFSNSDADRTIVKTAGPASPPDAWSRPCANRLKYYHLPEVWKSRGYFTHPGGTPAGKFFPALSKREILAAESTAKALVFCLDDLVLTDENLHQVQIDPKERVALFHHRFANRKPASPTPLAAEAGDLSNEGIYKPGAEVFNTAGGVGKEAFPYGTIEAADPLGRANHDVFYINDYPDWTRLVIAVGNLFDAFDDRVPDDPANEVVGARAAVRWVDLTQWKPVSGSPPVGQYIDRVSGVTARPALVNKDYFQVQPLYFQDFLSRNYGPTGPAKHLEWAGPYDYPAPNEADGHYVFRNGRADIAHLRCCDHDADDEIAILIRYHRFSANFDLAVCNTEGKRKGFARDLVVNVNDRWNSPVPNQNVDCAWILPKVPSPPNPAAKLRTKVVTFAQYVPQGPVPFLHHHAVAGRAVGDGVPGRNGKYARQRGGSRRALAHHRPRAGLGA